MPDKTALRKAAEARRQELARAVPEFAAAAASFAGQLALPEGAAVAGYAPVRGEADPRVLMLALAERGHPLALPRIAERGQPLQFHLWKDGDAMAAGAFGIAEPLAAAAVVTPSVLLVPMLAFDGEGYRLGYGGGFYDRTLAALRAARKVLAIGVAYAGQEVPALPHAAHDARLDAVLTEKGLRRF